MATEMRYTAEEYLQFERASEERHELVDGRIHAKGPATLTHATIVGNIAAHLRNQLRGRGCLVLAVGMRVKVVATGMYAYPDVLALCHPPAAEDANQDTLLNPEVIIEVLSETTQDLDLGVKFIHYRRMESLREYIVVADGTPAVEHWVRDHDRWRLSDISGLEGTVRIEALDCELPLAEIYEDVEFPPAGTRA